MAGNDRQHFAEYRLQTAVKHKILTSYVPAYLAILKKQSQVLRYIDGFAGQGQYTDGDARRDGSPLLILKDLVERPNLFKRVSTHFIERDPVLFAALKGCVIELCSQHRDKLLAPDLRNQPFDQAVREILADAGSHLGATFLFVDPCGVSGVSFEMLADVVRRPRCEAFVFFNSTGLKRVIGDIERPENARIVQEFFGDASVADGLGRSLAICTSADAKEHLLLETYRAQLQLHTQAKYFLPFRIEEMARKSTSHYLVHVSKNPLGFRIMKDVMLETLRGEGLGSGILGFAQASTGFSAEVIPFHTIDLRQRVIDRLSRGPMTVRAAMAGCESPTDFYSQAAWREMLIQLEKEMAIEVFADAACEHALPASMRKSTKTHPITLGEGHTVRLKRAKA